MSSAKEQISKLVKDEHNDSSSDETIHELAFDLMVRRGLKDSDEGRTVSSEEMHRYIRTWQK